MPIDFRTASYSRQYRDEQGDFRRLSLLTKAIAAYLRNLVDPVHGWLHLHGDAVAVAFSKQAAGSVTQSDRRLLVRCIDELVGEGYLLRCRVTDTEPGVFVTHDEREVPLSSWLDDARGDWVVIANWVPAQNGLSRDETLAWHAARRAHLAAKSSQPAILLAEHVGADSASAPGVVEVQ